MRSAACSPALRMSPASSRVRGSGVAPRDELGVADDGGEEVVEVVRDAAGEPADGLHLLRLAQLLLAFVERLLGQPAIVHFAEQALPLLEEAPHHARELAEFVALRLQPRQRAPAPCDRSPMESAFSGRVTQPVSEASSVRKSTMAKPIEPDASAGRWSASSCSTMGDSLRTASTASGRPSQPGRL